MAPRRNAWAIIIKLRDSIAANVCLPAHWHSDCKASKACQPQITQMDADSPRRKVPKRATALEWTAIICVHLRNLRL
jgi:hypothetical protein